jgi:hypothetical protein
MVVGENADAAQHPIISINGSSYRAPGRLMTGAELRQLPTPPLTGDVDLLFTRTAEDDLFVDDGQIVELTDGAAFVAVPRTILAGRPSG